MELDALVYLLCDRFHLAAVRGVERLVVAEGAAPVAFRAVAVRAGEPPVDGEFLSPPTEKRLEIAGVRIIPHRNHRLIALSGHTLDC